MQPHQLPLDSVSWRLYNKTVVVPRSTVVCLLSVPTLGRVSCPQAPLFSTARNARRPRMRSQQAAPPTRAALQAASIHFFLEQESQEGEHSLNLGPVLCFG